MRQDVAVYQALQLLNAQFNSLMRVVLLPTQMFQTMSVVVGSVFAAIRYFRSIGDMDITMLGVYVGTCFSALMVFVAEKLFFDPLGRINAGSKHYAKNMQGHLLNAMTPARKRVLAALAPLRVYAGDYIHFQLKSMIEFLFSCMSFAISSLITTNSYSRLKN